MSPRPSDRSLLREASGSQRPEPGILCWNCRKLTPFHEDRCQFCGAAFAGSTGGEYAMSRLIDRPARRPPASVPDVSRTLADLLSDIQKVHDVAARPSPLLREADTSVVLFQCPSCGRFVSERATGCVCGVRFAAHAPTFACPECDSRVPELEDTCPVCGTRFEPEPPEVSYSCPKCGTFVAADAIRCACGVWFED